MAATRIKLDLDSTDTLDFEREVSIPTPDGRELKIPFTYIYRDRVAMAELFDEFAQQAKDDADRGDAVNAEVARAVVESDVQTIMQIANGWGIEGVKFTAENIRKLCVRYAGAATAILLDYRVSLTQGRLGN